MPISKKQIDTLLGLISDTESDNLDCDGCFGQLAEFADAKLANQEIPVALQAVEQHLKQCTCCCDEFETLLEGLRGLE